MTVHKVALLTAGGLAPCLSSAVGGLIERYSEMMPDIEIIAYQNGYHGLLLGNHLKVTPQVRSQAAILHRHGGSPIGNSRVKLTNVKDCVKRGLVQAGQDPLEVAAQQLEKDGVTILHTIGGDDTNLTAADLAKHLAKRGSKLTVVGLPKTVDNDVVPIRQSLGAWTAAEQGALFFENVVNEASANPRTLIIHEVMGRNCGWLTAATARKYRERLSTLSFVPGFGLSQARKDIDAVYLPEMALDIPSEAARIKKVMDQKGCACIFISEGAAVSEVVAEMAARGIEVERDPFGHLMLDKVNVGNWFAQQFGQLIGAEKTLVQKSGYFARASAANADDLRLIKGMVDLAVDAALHGTSGVIGHDEERNNVLRAIEFTRIRGGKAFDITTDWFVPMLAEIGQPKPLAAPAAAH
ncbi:MAG: pyrophosphate--fructose-6-phosphate 1-phosphotransferase [Hyphomicrobiales bacterium]|nr:pyrophosphate--fructose-6-phosphate 1-phosphotransferase [Hyphomicrobiales bacterium]MDE2115372.1 pyrophosphate--fructose-6-phosphate 1-phosphotransferase [Hyphomicrobiales bacterium]